MQKVVLLLDDEASIRRDLGSRLERAGFGVHKAEKIEEAKKIILSERIDYAVIDLKVDYKSEYGGIEVLKFAKRHQPRVKTVILSAYRKLEEDIYKEVAEQIDAYVSKNGKANYIVAVTEILNGYASVEEAKKCFVIMPFSSTTNCSAEEWTEIFEEMIKPSVESLESVAECTRSCPVQGSIIEDIMDNLNSADIMIADLTDRNPNVFYELGVRHTLRDSTILIAQNINDIPFDLRGYAIQTYDWKTKQGKEKFRDEFEKAMTLLIKDPIKGTSPVRKYLQL